MLNPDGAHSIAVGLDAPLEVEVDGHAGYYAAGMNKHAHITVHGNAGPGVAENMMSGTLRVEGFASTAAGASAHGGLLVIDGDASLRCGISLKGGDIVVGGSVGSFSAFMAQAGRIVICGDAGDALGDSLYEAVIYVRGKVRSLGADARFEPMTEADYAAVRELLERAGLDARPDDFQRVASARACTTGMPMPTRSIESETMNPTSTCHAKSPPASTGASSTTSSARRPRVCTKSAAWAPSATCRIRRPGVPRRVAVALSAGGLPREMHDAHRAGHALREQARRTRHARSPSRA